MMALPDRLPRAELRRQVSPGDAGAVTVDRTLNQIPMLSHRPAHSAFHRRQQRLDPSPHLIAEQRHTSHCCSIAPKRRSTLETRPSPKITFHAPRLGTRVTAFGYPRTRTEIERGKLDEQVVLAHYTHGH